MSDVVDQLTRSRMMKSIRGRDTKPELALRRYLHSMGYRFRLHRKDLYGSPDLVLPRYRLAIFVHGCFWHRHANCFYSTTPKSRQAFWETKFAANIRRDQKACTDLQQSGWRILIVWECGFKHCLETLRTVPHLIESSDSYREWPASPPRTRSSE